MSPTRLATVDEHIRLCIYSLQFVSSYHAAQLDSRIIAERLPCRFDIPLSAHNEPYVFAAAVPLAGTGCPTSPVTEAGAAALAPSYVGLPIWTFHGDADTTLSIDGTNGMVAAIRAAGGTNIKYTVISGGTHNIWTAAAATDGLVDWIFAQKNDNFVNTINGEVVPETDPMDFNGDGKVDLTDALDMLRALLNGNRKYTLKNVLEVLKTIVTEG